MICANPTCGKEFEPVTHDQRFCCARCRKLYNDRLYKARHKDRPRKPRKPVRIDPNSTHPCKRCGGAAKYRKVFCEACLNQKPSEKGQGIAPLRTPAIRASRVREQEAIDRVVAKAKANGTVGSIDFWNDANWQAGGYTRQM